MTEPSLAAQAAVRNTLIAASTVTDLVAASAIIDKNERPQIFPCIIIGEGQVIDAGVDCTDDWDVFLDLHVWTKEPGLGGCKAIVGAVQAALRGMDTEALGARVWIDKRESRFLRDPSGDTAHGVVSIDLAVSL